MKAKIVLSLLFIIASTAICLAGPPPPPPQGSPLCWPPPCVPIDGGISLLIAAGALYGGKKLYNKQKENKSLS